MIAFQNDMSIPIYNFLNQYFEHQFKNKKLKLSKNEKFNFFTIKDSHFPIYKLFKNIDKNSPSDIIKFNVANEYAVNLFKKNMIIYTDIYKIIAKISSLNLNYKLNNIKDIISYHELLEQKIKENTNKYI